MASLRKDVSLYIENNIVTAIKRIMLNKRIKKHALFLQTPIQCVIGFSCAFGDIQNYFCSDFNL